VIVEVGEANLNWPPSSDACREAGVEWMPSSRTSASAIRSRALAISYRNLAAMAAVACGPAHCGANAILPSGAAARGLSMATALAQWGPPMADISPFKL